MNLVHQRRCLPLDEIAIVLQKLSVFERQPFRLKPHELGNQYGEFEYKLDDISVYQDGENQHTLLKRPQYNRRISPHVVWRYEEQTKTPNTPKDNSINRINRNSKSLQRQIVQMEDKILQMKERMPLVQQMPSLKSNTMALPLKRLDMDTNFQAVLHSQTMNQKNTYKRDPMMKDDAIKQRSYSIPVKLQNMIDPSETQQQKFHSLLQKLDLSKEFTDCRLIIRGNKKKKNRKQNVRFDQ